MGDSMSASMVLCAMDRPHEAAYGFRSWMLQDTKEPHEVILNLSQGGME